MKVRVTFFQDDDETPIVGSVDGNGVVTDPSFSSDPAHARPYLQEVEEFDEAEIDLLEGTATIGQLNLVIVDKRRITSDQDTGIFTYYMAKADGDTAMIGRRARVEIQRSDGQWVLMLDGVVTLIEMQKDIVTYRVSIKDIRERGNEVPVFTKMGQIAVYPRGPINGYGKLPASGVDAWIVPPAPYARGKFKLLGANYGHVVITQDHPLDEQVYRYGIPQPVYDDSGSYSQVARYKGVTLKWAPASGGVITTIVDPPFYATGWPTPIVWKFPLGKSLNAIGINMVLVRIASDDPSDLPSDGQNVLVRVEMQSQEPPTDAMPIYIENQTFGQVLKDVYDGVYSDTDPRIRYDEAVMADLVANTPICRAVIKEPADDLNEWVRENIYKPLGMAPALKDGKIAPIKYELPDATITLLQLDNNNSEFAEWKHDGDNALNEVIFRYKRDHYVVMRNALQEVFNQDGTPYVQEIQVEHIHRHTSAELVGPKTVEYEPVTVRALSGFIDGNEITGDVVDETGAKLAQARGRQAIDRFAFGAQRYVVKATRSDAGVNAAKVGDWVLVAHSHLPNYGTRERNANRLAQIVKTKDIDPVWREFELEDAGTAHAPLGVPTGTVSRVGVLGLVDVTAIAANSEARIDYAIVDLLDPAPDASSPLWTFLGRGGIAEYFSPPLPSNKTVHFRFRGEGVGRRPSAWAAVGSINIPEFVHSPFTTNLYIDSATGNPIATWQRPSAAVQGLRLYYAIHEIDDTNPTLSSTIDVNAADLEYVFDGLIISNGSALTVEFEGWSGWSGSAVTGSASSGRVRRVIVGSAPRVRPKINFVSVVPRFSGGLIVGWQVSGSVDDSAMSIRATLTSGLSFTLGQDNLIETDTDKTFVFNLDQSAGGEGKISLVAWSDLAGTINASEASERILSRPPITTHAIQRISRTEFEVTLRSNPSTATIKYRSYLSTETPPAFSTYASKFRVPITENEDRILEFYSEIAGGFTALISEEIKSVIIDGDHRPEVTFVDPVVQVDGSSIEMNFIVDDDCDSYEIYMRLGSWPTLDGTNTDLDSQLDPRWRRGPFKSDQLSYSHYASAGTWYLVVRGRDFNGVAGPADSATITVTGSPPTAPQIMAPIAVEYGAGSNRGTELRWSHTAAIDTDYSADTPRYKVVIYEAINRGEYQPLVTLLDDRRAAQDHDGTNGVPLQGSYRTGSIYTICVKNNPNCNFITLKYKIELWDTDGTDTLLGTIFTSREAYYSTLV